MEKEMTFLRSENPKYKKTWYSFQRAWGRCGNEGAADSSTPTKGRGMRKCEREEMGVLKLLAAVSKQGTKLDL
jgi:hypothetical protein